ncbi:MAG: ligase-associated DNA damage response exonuclease [Bacteroidota bacterium]
MPLLEFTDRGIYCRPADVYLDAWRPVDRVIVTHGHSDHARWGHRHYLAHHLSVPIMKARLGQDITIEGKNYNEPFTINGVTFSLHPAGHIIGAAQVRVEHKGEVWVFTGDFKTENDGISAPFEPVKCHAFITECTFGIPAFQWQTQQTIFDDINQWWNKNREDGKVSVISAYSLGKAQRILQGIDPSIGPIYTHGAVENMNQVIRDSGISLNPTTYINKEVDKKQLKGALVIAPPSALGTPWQRSLGTASTAVASGWMGLRGARRRRSVDRGFILSDHADWKGLNETVIATGAERVIATHGYSNIFTRWLREQGLDARTEATQFEGEGTETADGE